MSSKFKEIMQQAKEAKETIDQVIDDIQDVIEDILNIDPYLFLCRGKADIRQPDTSHRYGYQV